MRAGKEPARTDSQLAAGQRAPRQNLRNTPSMAKAPCVGYLFSCSKQRGFLVLHEKWKQEGVTRAWQCFLLGRIFAL